ncbi:MAG: phosphoglucosamine mutase [Phycisphaerae bacterium]
MGEDRLMVSVSGVRGTIGSTLTPIVACEFGCAFGTYLGAGKTVVIGRDTRPSGAMVQSAVTAGLLAAGVSVVDLGVASTPGIALMIARTKSDGGVVITASHNPIEYNGIKFLQPTGPGLTAAAAAKLKSLWQAKAFKLAGAVNLGQLSRNTKTHAEHVDAVCAVVDSLAIASKRFKVVLDSINGAGCVATPMLLGRLGCEYVHLNGEATGRFAHTPEPIRENITDLCTAVRKHKAAVGFAQDPDADRLVIVDENGNFLGEEYTLALAMAFALRTRKGKVATNLVTSRMVDDVAAAAGCQVIRTPTGEANVAEAMAREGCVFGGEGNGGVMDPRVIPVRDSLVGIAMILQYMAQTGKTISQLAAEIPAYQFIKTKFPCPEGVAPKVIGKVKAEFADRKDAKFNESDGLRVDLPEGWLSVRASNTEPIMRIVAEARDAATARSLVDQARALADAVIGKKPQQG